MLMEQLPSIIFNYSQSSTCWPRPHGWLLHQWDNLLIFPEHSKLPPLARAYIWEDRQVLHHQRHVLLRTSAHWARRTSTTTIPTLMTWVLLPQTYLTSIATRAVIFIKVDNPSIETVAFVGVGMAEISTCDITVKKGQHVKKGEQLWMFHYRWLNAFSALWERGLCYGLPGEGWGVECSCQRGVGCCSITWFLLFEQPIYLISMQ